MFMLLALLVCMLFLGLQRAAAGDEPPAIRVAVLKFGTVNWFLDTMQHYEIDRRHGFRLEILPLASKNATSVAFLSGSVDAFVTDWFWAMEERNKANSLSFRPYSTVLGALITPAESASTSLAALRDKKIGIAGGPLDKSWLLMQVFAEKQGLSDFAKRLHPVFAAPPLLNAQIENKALDGVLTYWHFAARLSAAGYRTVMTVEEAMRGLGIDPAPPLVGFVHREAATDVECARWRAFGEALRDTNELLAKSDPAWERLRSVMKVQSEAEFTILRDTYRHGIASSWGAPQTDSARTLYALMKQIGGSKIIPEGSKFDSRLFYPELIQSQ